MRAVVRRSPSGAVGRSGTKRPIWLRRWVCLGAVHTVLIRRAPARQRARDGIWCPASPVEVSRAPEPVERVIHGATVPDQAEARAQRPFTAKSLRCARLKTARVPARNTCWIKLALTRARSSGRRKADAARPTRGGELPAVTALLEQVQIDHTVIDPMVDDPRPVNLLPPVPDPRHRRVHPLRARHGRHAGSAVCCSGWPVPRACRDKRPWLEGLNVKWIGR